ncbi:hypothetical protein [Candidatus Thalassolituus haligoni]|jgi:hypothetical protein|tara:strand:+ start:185 stop:310 length:126 start_codon:yes stop_codon:yes gene_type:complete
MSSLMMQQDEAGQSRLIREQSRQLKVLEQRLERIEKKLDML